MTATRRERLFDQLWPTPAPRRDLAEQVLARLAESGRPQPGAAGHGRPAAGPARLSRPGRSPPTPSRPRQTSGRVLVGALSLAAAAVFSVAVSRTWLDVPEIAAQGQQVARQRVTINIADRAAAAMEPGADLVWTVQKQRVRVEQRRGSVFYRVDRGDKFRVTTPAGDVEVTGTCFRVSLGAASTLSAMVTMVSVLEGSVKVSSGPDGQTLSVQAGETVRLEAEQPPVAASENAPRSRPALVAAGRERQLREQAAAAEARLRALEQLLASSRPAGSRRRRPGRRCCCPRRPACACSATSWHGSAWPARRRQGRAAAVEVARDPGFKRTVFAGPARDAYVTVPAPARGDLYWRLAGSAELAGHARFLPDRRRSSRCGARTTWSARGPNAPPSTSRAPPRRSRWRRGDPRRRHHRIRIYRQSDPQRPLFDRTVAGPRCRSNPGCSARDAINGAPSRWTPRACRWARPG